MPVLLDAEPSFKDGPDGLIIRKDQEITPEFLDSTAAARNRTSPEREFMHVAAIPTIVVEVWKSQGFDIMAPGVSAKEIVKRLKRDGLESFLATSKRV